MRAFAAAWQDKVIMQRVIAQIPWRSNIARIDKPRTQEERLWYARNTRVRLVSAARFADRNPPGCTPGKAVNNFETALPPAESDMAIQAFQDPYIFDFLGTAEPRRELDLENSLMEHVQVSLELVAGFAYVGRQVLLEIGESDFYLDLLFYHLKLRCYVVIETKAGKFEPGHVSQLNMYLNAVDDLLRHPYEKPTIGLLLVKEKNQLVAEYALRGYTKPICVAKWKTQITRSLPEELKSSLPTIEVIEAALGGTEEVGG